MEVSCQGQGREITEVRRALARETRGRERERRPGM